MTAFFDSLVERLLVRTFKTRYFHSFFKKSMQFKYWKEKRKMGDYVRIITSLLRCYISKFLLAISCFLLFYLAISINLELSSPIWHLKSAHIYIVCTAFQTYSNARIFHLIWSKMSPDDKSHLLLEHCYYFFFLGVMIEFYKSIDHNFFLNFKCSSRWLFKTPKRVSSSLYKCTAAKRVFTCNKVPSMTFVNYRKCKRFPGAGSLKETSLISTYLFP